MVQTLDNSAPAPPYTEVVQGMNLLSSELNPAADIQTERSVPRFTPANDSHIPNTVSQPTIHPYEMGGMRESLPPPNRDSYPSAPNGEAVPAYSGPFSSRGQERLASQFIYPPNPSLSREPSGQYQHYGSSSGKPKSSGIRSMLGGGPKKSDIEDVYIAVMGVTGAGKSSFISLCTKQSVVIGHNLVSCTMEVEDFTFMWNDKIRIHLIDTPGFDDTKRKDTDVLRDIAGWMAVTYTNKIKLSGIIYLHRITDPRMGGTQMRNLTMFKELCGKQCFPAVILATTFWGDVDAATGAERERQLVSNDEFWGFMAKKGSRVVRHLKTRGSAMDIVDLIVKRHTTIVLDIQDDMVNKGLDLDETLAGQSLNRELIEQQRKHREEMKHLEAEMRKAIAEKDEESVEAIAQMQKNFQDKINQGNKDVQDLQASLQNLKEERDREMLKIQEELEERAAYYKKKEEEWDLYQKNNAIDPAEAASREEEMNMLREQLKDLIEKGERKKTGVWYQVGEFFEEVVDDIKSWWKTL